MYSEANKVSNVLQVWIQIILHTLLLADKFYISKHIKKKRKKNPAWRRIVVTGG